MFDILSKPQGLHAFDEFVFERELEVEPQPSFHRLIYLENDVLGQVVSQLLNPHRNFILIRLHNIFYMRHAFIACTSEINFTSARNGLVTHHPHCKNKPETRVLPPEARHVPNTQPLPRKRHTWIADDQRRVVLLEHLLEIGRARGPLRLALPKLSKDHFHERRRRARRLIQRHTLDILQSLILRHEYNTQHFLLRADAYIRHERTAVDALILNHRHPRAFPFSL